SGQNNTDTTARLPFQQEKTIVQPYCKVCGQTRSLYLRLGCALLGAETPCGALFLLSGAINAHSEIESFLQARGKMLEDFYCDVERTARTGFVVAGFNVHSHVTVSGLSRLQKGIGPMEKLFVLVIPLRGRRIQYVFDSAQRSAPCAASRI